MKSLQVMLDEHNFSYLDPDKRLRVSDNTLKLIQKQALLDYYQRHNHNEQRGSNNNQVKISPAGSGSGPGPGAAAAAALVGGTGSAEGGGSAQDSGFYSPTESGPPGRQLEDHSAVINGADHPDQSSTELNGLEVS